MWVIGFVCENRTTTRKGEVGLEVCEHPLRGVWKATCLVTPGLALSALWERSSETWWFTLISHTYIFWLTLLGFWWSLVGECFQVLRGEGQLGLWYYDNQSEVGFCKLVLESNFGFCSHWNIKSASDPLILTLTYIILCNVVTLTYVISLLPGGEIKSIEQSRKLRLRVSKSLSKVAHFASCRLVPSECRLRWGFFFFFLAQLVF